MIRNKGLRDIELDTVLDGIRKASLFPESIDTIGEDAFTTDRSILEQRYLTIDDYMARLEDLHNLDAFPAISHIFTFIKETHRDIPSVDVYKAGAFLAAYQKMLIFLERGEEFHEDDEAAMKDILSSLDYEGNVFENHPRLVPLRRALEETRSKRNSFSFSFMKNSPDMFQNDSPVYRNERVVIPIRSDKKNQVECYVQGSSASGQTLYVEPFQLVELNNNVVIQEERIRQEIDRIKHELSEKVRALVPHLKKKVEEVKIFDFHYVFAVWARRNKCRHPQAGDMIKLVSARHPLLGAKAVPIDVEIDEKTKAVVLSGANAGGKTVTMKTIALLIALNQICGHIPASELSVLPVFDRILTDIGDGQSIENEASTFSSHLKNIAYVTGKATEQSLVLLDELGSGTDPEEGSALSCAILRYLSTRVRLTLVTSHYSKVKNLAYTSECMMNASMEFDTHSGLPTYKVLSGIPGDSHAIDAAVRMKLPKCIIDEAREELGDESQTSAKIINSLLSKSRTLDRKIGLLETEKRKLQTRMDELEAKEKQLDKKDFELEKQGHRELSDFVSETRKELENLIKDIREGKLTSEKTKKAKNFIAKLEKNEKKFADDVRDREEQLDETEYEVFNVGDDVFCGASRQKGRIIAAKGKNSYVVSLENGLKMTLKADLLEKANEKKKVQIAHFELSKRKAEYVLDVRGLTLREAIEKLDDQMEAVMLSSMPSFSIIHGFGNGILQAGITDYLRHNKDVSNFFFARPEDGGMGKTYVEVKQS